VLGWPRNDTDDHGRREMKRMARRGFLAKPLSSQRGWRAGFNTKARRARRFLAVGWRAGVGHGKMRMITEGGMGGGVWMTIKVAEPLGHDRSCGLGNH
jgi:hypothetical protein